LADYFDAPGSDGGKEGGMSDRSKMIFGFALLGVIGSLATIIALGKVMEQSSYGLQIILGCITTLSGGFAAWAFGSRGEK
jgi:hypothetical protein